MRDCFALLGQPRRPWLDPEQLKEKFHQLAAAHHPDVAQDGDFAGLNAAYNTLRDPKTRVAHLLELEASLPTAAQIPPDLAELFLQLGECHQQFKRLLHEQQGANSSLLKALLAPRRFQVLEALEAMAGTLETANSNLLNQLQEMDSSWESAPDLEKLRDFYQRLSYLAKWQTQTREAIATLAID